jgi:hypothetical protein
VGETIVAILLGAGFLHAFFRAAQFQWPGSYFTLDTGLGYAITSTPLRYIGFRFAPVFLVALFAAASLDSLDVNPIPAVAGIVAIHIASTTGRATVGLARDPGNARRSPLLLLHLTVSAGVIVAAAMAIALRGPLGSLVPPAEDLSASLWTAVFAGVMGVYVLQLSRSGDGDITAILKKSRRAIGPELWDSAEAAAVRHAADVNLVRAFMLVENVQRPRWFRNLEHLKGLVFGSGTYGIMQVRADKPLSDEESIEQAIRERLAGVVVPFSPSMYPGSPPFPGYASLVELAKSYNDDSVYADAVANAYLLIHGDVT